MRMESLNEEEELVANLGDRMLCASPPRAPHAMAGLSGLRPGARANPKISYRPVSALSGFNP